MIVVDASAMIDLLNRAPNADRIEALLDDDVCAPDTIVPEVVRQLSRHERADPMAHSRFEVFSSFELQFLPTWPHIRRIWELRHSVSAYDACYVAVAEALDCALLTTDARLAGSNGARVPIIAL
jgi:predicted nucleic acid-binding protein